MSEEQSDSRPLQLIPRLTGEPVVGEPVPMIFLVAETGEPYSGLVEIGRDGATFWGR